MYNRAQTGILAILTYMSVSSSALAAPAEIAGHYYLQGVMETGSELLLRPDGHFQWYISYGAVDQNAEGTWALKGGVVTLTSEGPDRRKPMFRLDEQVPWEAAHEQLLLDRAHESKVAMVEQNCPLLQAAAYASSPMPFPLGEPDKAAFKAKADAARLGEQKARQAGEALAAEAIAKLGAPGSDARVEAAQQAISDWYSARYEMEAAYRMAEMDPPPRVELRLPATCDLPAPEARADDDHPERWTRGIIIGIADPDMGVAPKGISVTLTYADGTQVSEKTARRGWALFPKRAGVKASHVLIDPAFAPWARAEFDFPPLETGLQAFAMDARLVTAAPFETMALRVNGKDLIPENLGRGRYVKEGQK